VEGLLLTTEVRECEELSLVIVFLRQFSFCQIR
jgi:hypothetical protein